MPSPTAGAGRIEGHLLAVEIIGGLTARGQRELPELQRLLPNSAINCCLSYTGKLRLSLSKWQFESSAAPPSSPWLTPDPWKGIARR